MIEIKVGDRVSIDTKKIGQVRRSGVVTGVSQGLSGVRYTVAWDSGASSSFTPGMGNLMKEAGGRTSKAKANSKVKPKASVAKAKAKVKAKVKTKPTKTKAAKTKVKAKVKAKTAKAKAKPAAKKKKSKR
jgi:hypothetical protein